MSFLSRLSRSTSRISIQSQILTQSTKRWFADEGKQELKPKELPQAKEETPEFFNFTMSCPHKELFVDAPVRVVGVPGSDGRFAASPGHIPIVCEMQPGIVSLYYEKSEGSGRQDHYFVAGGMCLIHPNTTMEIAATEAVLLSDIDTNNLKDGLAKARDKMSKASDEKEKFQAEIEIETYETLQTALQQSL